MSIKINTERVEKEYPGYKLTGIIQFRRENQDWKCSIGRKRLTDCGGIEDQIKAALETGAVAVCIRLLNKKTDHILIPDKDINLFIDQSN